MIWILISFAALYLLVCLLYILFQEKLLFHPQHLSRQHTFTCEADFEELDLTTPERKTISAVFIHPKDAKGMVIYYHGNMNHLEHYLPFTKKFWSAGYAVLIMDYRGFGKSTGKLSEKNFFLDAEMIYQNALTHFPGEQIILYGRSMGTAAACYVASRHPCRHLILEAPFCSLYDLARRLWMWLPDGKYLKFSFRNDLHLQQVKAPVTIFHGTKDRIVSIKSGMKLKSQLKEGDEFIALENGRHNNLDQFELYHERLNEILNK